MKVTKGCPFQKERTLSKGVWKEEPGILQDQKGDWQSRPGRAGGKQVGTRQGWTGGQGQIR